MNVTMVTHYLHQGSSPDSRGSEVISSSSRPACRKRTGSVSISEAVAVGTRWRLLLSEGRGDEQLLRGDEDGQLVQRMDEGDLPAELLTGVTERSEVAKSDQRSQTKTKSRHRAEGQK